MKFPSLSFIYRNAAASFRRFPFAILAALTAAICMVWLLEADSQGKDPHGFLYTTSSLAILGIPLFTAIVTTAERWKPGERALLISQFTGLLLLVVYFLVLPQNLFDAPDKHIIRLALFFVEAHLLVAVAPFISKGSINGFWQYNKSLFLRFLTAVLYANVLFAGLAVALLSIDALLGIEIEGVRYAQLWVLIVIIFNTWFFLAGVPENINTLDHTTDYPGGLKLFTQYILLPLVSVYVVILYLYAGKIMIAWSWPEGWVANLILSFSVLGIFSLLLLHPIRDRAGSVWVKRFSKGYYLVLLPLVLLLLLAIWRRISEYGFTENRYFVLLAGVWLGGIALYFLFSGKKNIKIIPVSLAAIVLLISFGPWGAISVSESSQIQRLRSTLIDHNILSDGKISAARESVPREDVKEISAGVRYLANVHGLHEIQPWFGQNFDHIADTSASANQLARSVVELMGLEYVHAWEDFPSDHRYFSSSPGPVHLDENTWLISNQRFNPGRDTSLVTIGSRTFIFQLQPDSMLFSIRLKEQETPMITVNLSIKTDDLAREFAVQQSHSVPADKMTVGKENESVRVQLFLRHISIKKEPPRWQLQNLEMDVLLTFKSK